MTDYLRRKEWLQTGEVINQVEPLGDGTMNFAVRVRSNLRSFVLKQARPWMERFPEIAAPDERLLAESRFYELVAAIPIVSAKMPKWLGVDPESRILALEDLGRSTDLVSIYGEEELMPWEWYGLVDYLAALHSVSFASFPPDLENIAMRQLNFSQIFELPYQSSGVAGLDEETQGLAYLAQTLRKEKALVSAASAIGAQYLKPGTALLHGDFGPGSWLQTDSGVKVIDPEFSIFGPAEFDLGTMLAHLYLARQANQTILGVLERYQAKRNDESFDTDLCLKFTGAEILRRLIGLNQLPLPRNLEWKKQLLAFASELLLKPSLESLREPGAGFSFRS